LETDNLIKYKTLGIEKIKKPEYLPEYLRNQRKDKKLSQDIYINKLSLK